MDRVNLRRAVRRSAVRARTGGREREALTTVVTSGYLGLGPAEW
jgi:hypothetical protein